MIYKFCFLFIFLFSCQEKIKNSLSLEITFNRINQNELLNKSKNSKLNNKCYDKILDVLETGNNFFEVLTFKNTAKSDIFLITTNECNVLLASYFFTKQHNFNGYDESYLIESPRVNPTLIKLSCGEEYFTYVKYEKNTILHSIQKLKYFNSQDSTFYNVWFKYPIIEIIRSPSDYISENRCYLSDDLYHEIYNYFIREDTIVSKSQNIIDSETLILKKIRTMY